MNSGSKKLLILFTICLTTIVIIVTLNFLVGEKKVKKQIPHLYGLNDPQFIKTMGVLLGPAIIDGNRFETLSNGEEIFPAMLNAIQQAKSTINFETYIYWSEGIGNKFSDALSDRARHGVKVHLLIDAVGSSKMDQAQLDKMEKAGVEIRKYRPLNWYNLSRYNNRTHRKLMVVDGRIGFTGGVGIANQWMGHAQDPEHWRDAHFQVEGPVVAQMQAALVDNWIKTTGEVLQGETYFPPLKKAGEGMAQLFSSSPTGGSESMQLMYLLAFSAAEHDIYISSSYFVPDELLQKTLIAALKRGVHISIITPGKNMDVEAVRKASRGLWGGLLEAGAKIYEYKPTMFHCKIVVVDGLLTSVGSTNLDERSIRLNDEANLNIYDADFARQQIAIFENDVSQSQLITFEQWRNRPLAEKFAEKTAAIMAPLL
jgi:cardiolipin synthase A/B